MGLPAVPAAERFYALRGDGYMYYFSRMVDMSAFAKALEAIEAASFDPVLPEQFWSVYNGVAKKRGKPLRTPK